MSCPKQFSFTLSDCIDEIIVEGGLQPFTVYYYRITDKFGNRWVFEITTNNEGAFVIDLSDLPSGLFTSFSGAFTLEISNTDVPFVPVNFWFCDEEYGIITLNFENNNSAGNIVFCESVEPSPTPNTKPPFPFAGYGNDTTTMVFDGTVTAYNPIGFDLVGKTLLSIATDGIQRNFNPLISPLDLTFDNTTGMLTFVGVVSSTTIITGTYK